MDHIGIDLGGRESQICVRSEDGQVVEEDRLATASLGRFLQKQPPSRVIVETCTEAFAVADLALAWGHEVRVVPATLVRSLGVGSRRTKTDQRDAAILSEVSCRIDLPSVHIPSETARERKKLCTMRESLVHMRTQGINAVRAWLRASAHRIRSGATSSFCTRVREFLEGGQLGVPSYIERHLKVIDLLNEQIAEADAEVRQVAQDDPLCHRLMTVPGVGPVTAVRFTAAIDEVQRFEDAHKLEAYVGLTPGEHSSGSRHFRLSITKAGPAALRWTLLQAAWSFRRTRRGSELWQWQHEIEKRRGPHVAVVALARKLTGILFAMWRDGTTYQPHRAAASPSSTP